MPSIQTEPFNSLTAQAPLSALRIVDPVEIGVDAVGAALGQEALPLGIPYVNERFGSATSVDFTAHFDSPLALTSAPRVIPQGNVLSRGNSLSLAA